MVWGDWEVAELRRMRGAGMTKGAIARALKVSSNAVSGKLWREGIEAPPKPRSIANRVASLPRPAPRPTPEPLIRPTPTPILVPVPPVARARSCCWPMGDPKEKGFRFCDAVPLILGRSYCALHYKIAYRPLGELSHGQESEAAD